MPSTVISSFHYNKGDRSLEVVFNSGNIYKYLDVPKTVFSDMKNAFSKGTFLNTHIKGHYRYKKVK